MQSDNTVQGFVGGVMPFVTAFFGIVLKFTFIDKFDAGTTPMFAFLVDTYMRPAWIDFIVLAYVSGFASLASRGRNHTTRDLWVYIGLPAVCFITCIFLVLGTRKAGLESDLLQVYVPLILTGYSLATTGARSVQQI